MTHLFYLLSAFAILWELYKYQETEKLIAFKARNEELEYEDKDLSYHIYMFLTLGYAIWAFVGLLSATNWSWFLLLWGAILYDWEE